MKSQIRIDFADVHGKGIEPIITVRIVNSDDPRDGLLKTLFQSTKEYLQIKFTHHKHIIVEGDMPDMDKSLILFKPRATEEELAHAQDLLNHIKDVIASENVVEMKAILNNQISGLENQIKEYNN